MTRRAVGASVDALSYHYPDGSPALRGVSLTFEPGERVALLGPNGAGKSTLLLHLAGLLPERRRYLHTHGPGTQEHGHSGPGRICVDGTLLSDATIGRIRDLVGMVFQDPDDQLFGLTVGEDVGYGPRARHWPADEIRRAVGDTLAAVGLGGHEHRSPHHLSTGEKRRVCLAGVLVCRPGLLLLDEPSSGLDPRGRRGLAELLNGLDATQILATHDLALVGQVCSRAIVIDGGTVAADGPVPEILADEELLLRHGLA